MLDALFKRSLDAISRIVVGIGRSQRAIRERTAFAIIILHSESYSDDRKT